jgi:hypothetical protein
LNTGHLINGNTAHAGICPLLRLCVDITDIGAFGIKVRVRLDIQPVTDAVGLEVRFF